MLLIDDDEDDVGLRLGGFSETAEGTEERSEDEEALHGCGGKNVEFRTWRSLRR